MDITTKRSTWRVTRRPCAVIDCTQDEDKVSIKSIHSAENAGMKQKGFGDGENTPGKNEKGKEGRKTLGAFNRLAGPVRTIDRPRAPTPIPTECRFRYTIIPPKLKCWNPFSKHTKVSSTVSTPPKLGKNSPPEHLYAHLCTKKRSLAASKCDNLNETKIDGDDPDIEILHEYESTDSASCSTISEIDNNYKRMPKLKRETFEPQIVPAFPRKTLETLKNVHLMKPRIRDEIIYYEKNFSVGGFLKTSNNPRHYFLNATRHCTYSSTSVDFLLNSYPTITVPVIRNAYKKAGFNTSLTALYLDGLKVTGGISRKWHLVEAEDISQLQEMKFIRELCKLPKRKCRE